MHRLHLVVARGSRDHFDQRHALLDVADHVKALHVLQMEIKQHDIEILLSQYAPHFLHGAGNCTQLDPLVLLQLATDHAPGMRISFRQYYLYRSTHFSKITSHLIIP